MRVALSNVMSSQVKKCPKCMECPECGQDPNYHYLVNQDLPNVLASKNNLPGIDKNSMFYFFRCSFTVRCDAFRRRHKRNIMASNLS